MKRPFLWKKLFKYAVYNVGANPYVIGFGLAMPLFMSIIIGKVVLADLPAQVRGEAATGMFLGFSTMVPMCVMLLGYSSIFSQDIEKGITDRLKLYGIPEKSLFTADLIVNAAVLVVFMTILTVTDFLVLDIPVPKAGPFFTWLFFIVLLAAIYFALARGLSLLLRRFGPVYAVAMCLYFFSMLAGGYMGLSADMLPKAVRAVANLLPTTYFGDFADLWMTGQYNFSRMILAFVFLGAVSGLLMFFGSMREKRIRS